MAQRRQGAPTFSWSIPPPTLATVAALVARFPEVLVIPDSALDADVLDWSANGLIGRSLGSWVPPEAIQREFRRLAVVGEITVIPLAHRCYLLKFASPSVRDFVLANPWSVNGNAFAFDVWRPDFSPADDAVKSALLWIRLPGLPIEFWGDEALRLIVASAGEYVFTDQCTVGRQRGGFARVCIRTNIISPLRPGVRVQGRGSPFWQQFTFEHLPRICPACGSLHLAGPCSEPQAANSAETAPCFGPWMAALRQRASTPAPPQSSAGMGDSSRGIHSASDEGWSTPKRIARR